MLALTSAGLAPYAAIRCPMAASVAAAGDRQGPHGGHVHRTAGIADHEQREASSARAGATAPAESTCTMPLGCGAPVIEAPRSAAVHAAAPTTDAPHGLVILTYATVFPTQDPPPPRQLV